MTSEETKNCLDCGYVLDGLPADRCPECGRDFDSANPKTYAVNNSRGRPFRSGMAYLLAAFASTAASIWFLATYQSVDNLYRPDWVAIQKSVWSAAQWTAAIVLILGAIQRKRNRYSWMFQGGMIIAGLTLGGIWALKILFAILWSI